MKRVLQGFGVVLMLSGIFPRNVLNGPEFDRTLFIVGALLFLSTFLTWKSNRKNNDLDSDPSKERGFSLIELLIVVAIIMIIAAISIPNLLRSRMAANEASAVGSIRTLNVAVLEYQSTYGAFPAALSQVGTTAGAPLGCNNAELVDAVITGGNKSGYTLTLVPGTQAVAAGLVPKSCTPGFTDGYVVIANPVSIGTTGQRAFCSDATGVIRANPTGTALYTSPLCDQTQSPLQ